MASAYEQDEGDEVEAVEPERVLPSLPAKCKVTGLERLYTVKENAIFEIVAFDEEEKRRAAGGEAFFVAIRGASRVRARIIDNDDGTYRP